MGLPNKVLGVTWESNISDRNIFIAYDKTDIFTFIYVRLSTGGNYPHIKVWKPYK